MKTARRKLQRSGLAATEMAMTLPVLCLICFISVDYSRLFYTLATLSDCARAGALYYSNNASATSSAIQAQALADASSLSPTPTVSSTTGTDANGNSYVSVTVSTTFTTLTGYPGITSSTTLSRNVKMLATP